MLAIDNVEDSLACAHLVKKHFPNLRIIARARNRHHAYAFKGEGIDSFVRETFDGSVALTGQVLKELGMEESEVTRTLQVFRTHDEQLLEETWEMRGDTQALRQRAADARAEFEKLFEADAAALSNEQ